MCLSFSAPPEKRYHDDETFFYIFHPVLQKRRKGLMLLENRNIETIDSCVSNVTSAPLRNDDAQPNPEHGPRQHKVNEGKLVSATPIKGEGAKQEKQIRLQHQAATGTQTTSNQSNSSKDPKSKPQPSPRSQYTPKRVKFAMDERLRPRTSSISSSTSSDASYIDPPVPISPSQAGLTSLDGLGIASSFGSTFMQTGGFQESASESAGHHSLGKEPPKTHRPQAKGLLPSQVAEDTWLDDESEFGSAVDCGGLLTAPMLRSSRATHNQSSQPHAMEGASVQTPDTPVRKKLLAHRFTAMMAPELSPNHKVSWRSIACSLKADVSLKEPSRDFPVAKSSILEPLLVYKPKRSYRRSKGPQPILVLRKTAKGRVRSSNDHTDGAQNSPPEPQFSRGDAMTDGHGVANLKSQSARKRSTNYKAPSINDADEDKEFNKGLRTYANNT